MAHSTPAPPSSVDVVVVGAGIVGASIAYHLAARGSTVVVLDAGLPASGATSASFAWIGAPDDADGPSGPLRRIAVDEYRRLERELPEVDGTWTGSLTWTDDPMTGRSRALSPDEIAALEPGLRTPPAAAVHRPAEGAIDPVGATEVLIDAALARGARVHVGTPAVSLLTDDGTVVGVRTPTGDVFAGTVVLAAGVGTVALCAALGVEVPVHPSPAVLVRLRTARRLLRGIVAAPDFEVRQDREGVLHMPLAYAGETTRAHLSRTARRAAQRLRAEVARADDAKVVSVDIGWRPIPADGDPIIGSVRGRPGLYLSVMHSGVTLAAAVGRLVATEISTGAEAPELRGCRLDRFGG